MKEEKKKRTVALKKGKNKGFFNIKN